MTHGEREMLVDERLPGGLKAALKPGMPCFEKETFLYFLERELTRAQRYGEFVGLILLDIHQQGGIEEGVPCDAAVEFLNRNLRKTDYVGALTESLLGIILLNSKPENTRRAVERLKSESLLYLMRRCPEAELRASSAVFPAEANSLDALLSMARERLSN